MWRNDEKIGGKNYRNSGCAFLCYKQTLLLSLFENNNYAHVAMEVVWIIEQWVSSFSAKKYFGSTFFLSRPSNAHFYWFFREFILKRNLIKLPVSLTSAWVLASLSIESREESKLENCVSSAMKKIEHENYQVCFLLFFL